MFFPLLPRDCYYCRKCIGPKCPKNSAKPLPERAKKAGLLIDGYMHPEIWLCLLLHDMEGGVGIPSEMAKGHRSTFGPPGWGAKVSGKNSDGFYSLFEITHTENVGPALHIHPKNAGSVRFLGRREYSVRCGNKTTFARAGDFLSLYPKEHRTTTSPARRVARCLPYRRQTRKGFQAACRRLGMKNDNLAGRAGNRQRVRPGVP